VHSLTSGGTERQLTETAKSLKRQGWDVHVACFHAVGIRAQELVAEQINIVELPVHSFLNLLSLSAGMLAFRDYVLKHDIKLVHSFDFPTAIFATLAIKLVRNTVLLTSQRSYRTIRSRRELVMIRLSDKMMDGIVVNCEAIRTHLVEDEGIRPEQIRLCYNGLDTERFRPDRQQVSRHPNLAGAVVVGTVCVLRQEKDLPTLLRGFAAAAAHNEKLRLVIVGSGPMLGELERGASRLGITDKVMFQPDTSNVQEWLGQMDIFVLSSTSEAFSNSLMEAMGSGLACIASRVGGNPELVKPGSTGLLFDCGNAEQLAEHILTFANDPATRRQTGAAGSWFIHSELTIKTAGDRMAAIYREYLGQAGMTRNAPESSLATRASR